MLCVTNNQVSIASFIYMCQQKGIDTNKFFLKDGKGTGSSLSCPYNSSSEKSELHLLT